MSQIETSQVSTPVPVSQFETSQVTVSPRVLALFDRAVGRRLRVQYRDRPEIYRELLAIAVITLQWEQARDDASGIVIATSDGALSEVVTTDEAAAAAGVAADTIRWHLRRGRLPGERRGRRWFITTEALAAFMIRRAA